MDDVTVSMYNVGFGDCFLLRIPSDGGERKVLIDCGSIKQGSARSIDDVVERIVADVDDGTGPSIDVVVITHRHRDHVSGFASELWRRVAVSEVWLPWTEDPDDPVARDILQTMASFAQSLRVDRDAGRFAAMSETEIELVDHVIDNTLALSNEAAMATVHRGFKGGSSGAERRFLDREPGTLDTEKALPGVNVHVLGPSRDEDIIRDMNPPSGESFLRVADDGGPDLDSSDRLPFEPIAVPPPDLLPAAVEERLREIARRSLLMGAVALESAVNNTSLMLVFEIGEAVLLFPGDAQWGTWKVNLDDDVRRDLLARTTFYKVGHHGSHNATPVRFVEDVLNADGRDDVWAAISVTRHGRFVKIPKAELVDELSARIADPTRLVRSDEPPAAPAPPMTVVRDGADVIRYDFTLST
ncbi:MBL fold metallo-hydrolase [Agromyces sp. SYSU T00266]|uniref:MBL fold metallo-hydrolase n=1 Tax=Agromyces zhanjiangensis TaxID=3158562 RepID=UPI003391C9A4